MSVATANVIHVSENDATEAFQGKILKKNCFTESGKLIQDKITDGTNE